VLEGRTDEHVQSTFRELALQLVVEQPMKIPFVAAVFLLLNISSAETAKDILEPAANALREHLKAGAWREVKLLLRFFACLQGMIEGDGVLPILEELFNRAVDLQTTSSTDGLGLELVKVIQLTIAYLMASSVGATCNEQALALLEKTDIIASTPHPLEPLVDAYPGNGEGDAHEPLSIIGMLQKQLQAEASNNWPLLCIPRPWNVENIKEDLDAATKHALPEITLPSPVAPGRLPRLPELYFSVYADQDIITVPPENDIASIIVRDSIVDTLNILDYNRNATAKFLIDIDCYFAPETFVKRATPFDKLRDVAGDKSMWKPEDIVVDAVFSQLLQLPMPEHKLVYYHSVLTEACKIAPAAIAPSLGRAIRWLYKNLDKMDLELEYRFMDWFSHHLSNFGFTWKWTEWYVLVLEDRRQILITKSGSMMWNFPQCTLRKLSLLALLTRKSA
jgi:nuclear cap-binding protein subunit 1